MCQTSSCRYDLHIEGNFLSQFKSEAEERRTYELLGNTDFLGAPIFKDNARSGEEQSVQWGHLTLCGRKVLCRAPPRVHCAPQGAIFEEIFLWWVFWVTWGANGSRVTSTRHQAFANNIQFVQNLNKFCFWNLCHCSILFTFRVPYLAHSISNMLWLPATCVFQSPKRQWVLLSRCGEFEF